MIRRDTLGRKIGHNWWREMIVQTWRDAYDAWLADAERVTLGYAAELVDYKRDHPTPTLKAFMIGLSR